MGQAILLYGKRQTKVDRPKPRVACRALKSEVYSDVKAYEYENIAPHLTDYDEVFDEGDDDGYPD